MYNSKKDIHDSFSVVKANQTKPQELANAIKVDIDSVKFNKKTIVVLCGNNTRDPQRASFYASCIYTWIDDSFDRKDIDIYSNVNCTFWGGNAL